jgi:tetratricopeptide (TPR) repeat protein
LAKDDSLHAGYKLQALEGLGDANATIGLFDSAMSFFAVFLGLCRDPENKIRVLRKSAECCLPTNKSNPAKALDLLNKAEEFGDVNPNEKGRISRIRGELACFAGKFDEAELCFSEAERLFEQNGEIEELAYTLLEYESPYLAQGRVKEALEKGKRAENLFSTLQSPEGESTILQWLGQVYFNLGLAKEALESLSKKIEIEKKFGHYTSLFWAYTYRCLVYESVDDFESAKTEAAKARECALKTESAYQLTDANALLAHCQIRLNMIDEGERLCNYALDAEKSIPTDVRAPAHVLVALANAELFAAKKNWDASNERFRQGIQLSDGAIAGLIVGTMIRTRFAEVLLKQGLRSEAKAQFSKAAQLYEQLGNETQTQRIRNIITGLG